MRIFVAFRDAIYVSGLRATLIGEADVESVDWAPSIALSWEHDALPGADVVVLDSELGGALAFVGDLGRQCSARVLLCLRVVRRPEVLEAVSSGVSGILARDLLTPDRLVATVRALAAGVLAFDPEVLGALDGSVEGLSEGRPVGGGFTPREQMVLRLVAAGLCNREIAERLSYSERTIKTILHDVVVKLGVKSRSQAVAMAVREHMI